MENWKETSLNMGIIAEGNKTIVRFYATSTIPKIVEFSSSCGCSMPTFNPVSGILRVNYKAGKVPEHLKKQGWYKSTPSINVKYENGEDETLDFTFKIIK